MRSFSPENAALVDLAPTDLPIHRLNRYHGDNHAVSVETFTPDDRKILFRLYDFLRGLFNVVRKADEQRLTAFTAYLERSDYETLTEMVTRWGVPSYDQKPSPLLAETIHDIRGGGLSAILGNIELWRRRGGRADSLCDTLYLLVRDHLKIMRNALLGLDDAQRTSDLRLKLHSTDLIIDKWQKLRLGVADKDLRLEAHCPYSISIAECCVEFGALDRILYNLLNNAARHTADLRVRLTLFPIPTATGPSLRFVMQNAVTATDLAYLQGFDLTTLFKPGVSTTGSGYGLAIVSEFVANAYGLSPREAIAGCYLGARVLGDDFTVWFHWPIVVEHHRERAAA